MANYRNISVEWLIHMHSLGCITLCDGDLQEVLDVIVEY